MSTQKLYRLKEMLCKEVDNMVEKGEMNAGDLEVAHKLTDTIKNIDKIIMLEESGDYSGDDMSGRSYARSRSYGDNDGYSGYRGQRRDSRGRYSRDGGSSYGNGNYSGHEDEDYSGRTRVRGYYRDGIKDRLEEIMQEAGTEKEKRAIQRAIESME